MEEYDPTLPQSSSTQPTSSDEIIETVIETLQKLGTLVDFRQIRMMQGGVEMSLFVISSLPRNQDADYSLADKKPHESQMPIPELTTPMISASLEEYHPMIQEAIGRIFQHKRFRNDRVLANSPLQKLKIVAQARQALATQRHLMTDILSEYDKATALRQVLTSCLDNHLRPEHDTSYPEKLSNMTPMTQRWIEYLILRWQYVEGESRQEVQQLLKQEYHCWLPGGTYARCLQSARERLSTLLWQTEVQAHQAWC